MEPTHTTDTPVAIATIVGPGDWPVLAAALRHLLARDGDRPARWATREFETAVDDQRARLVAGSHRPWGSLENAGWTFEAAVKALATDPTTVAVAVRQLEVTGCRRLAPWRSLLRSGLPATPSALETALWLG